MPNNNKNYTVSEGPEPNKAIYYYEVSTLSRQVALFSLSLCLFILLFICSTMLIGNDVAKNILFTHILFFTLLVIVFGAIFLFFNSQTTPVSVRVENGYIYTTQHQQIKIKEIDNIQLTSIGRAYGVVLRVGPKTIYLTGLIDKSLAEIICAKMSIWIRVIAPTTPSL